MTTGRMIGLAVAFVAGTPAAFAQTNNTATGADALFSNTTGSYNTATGTKALYYNTTGSQNTATGRRAMYSNVSGQGNTATGMNALYNNSSGNANTATGDDALLDNTTGEQNTATGNGALMHNTTGKYNTATGGGSMHSNTTASWNTAYGQSTLWSNTTGQENVAVGWSVLSWLETGNANTAVGVKSLWSTRASMNTGVGHSALYSNNSGGGNTAIGVQALSANASGWYNSAVGYGAGPATADLANTGAFGAFAQPTASNTIRIGDGWITSIGGYVAWSNLSDARVKTNVKENVPGLAFIKRLRPVTFSWDLDKLDAFDGGKAPREMSDAERAAKAAKVHTGFLAQEVEAAAQASRFDFSAVVKPANAQSRYELQYSQFVVPLVKAVQEQQKEVEELRETVRRLASGGQPAHASMFGSASSLVGIAFGLLVGAIVSGGVRVRRRDRR